MSNEQIILILFAIIILVLIYLLFRGRNNNEQTQSEMHLLDQISKLEEKINHIYTTNSTQGSVLETKVEQLDKTSFALDNKLSGLNVSSAKIDEKINSINDVLLPQNKDINTNLTNQLEIFEKMQNNLSEVAKQTQEVSNISTQIKTLEKIFLNKNERGIYGEVQLKNTLASTFGENNQAFQLQYSFENSNSKAVRVDAMLFVPEPVGNIPIDSKFPLENYLKQEKKLFEVDLKKHIDDISSKYIDPKLGITQALMFIPSESIYIDIIQSSYNMVEYGQSKAVWICSPTTLISILNTIQVIFRQVHQAENVKVIEKQLNELGIEFERYSARWEKLQRDLEKFNKDISDVNITTQKIMNKFVKIQKG